MEIERKKKDWIYLVKIEQTLSYKTYFINLLNEWSNGKHQHQSFRVVNDRMMNCQMFAANDSNDAILKITLLLLLLLSL